MGPRLGLVLPPTSVPSPTHGNSLLYWYKHNAVWIQAMAKRKRCSRGPKRRHWCGTENNPGEDSLFLRLENESVLPPGVKYVSFQLEKGEEGTPHYQIYIEFEVSRYVQWLKKHISKTAHWEPRKGSAKEASDYCILPEYDGKDKGRIRGPWIIGTISKGPGTRTDLVAFRDEIKDGKRKADLWESFPMQMAKYRRMYDDYNRCHKPKRTEELTVCLLIGKTGLGKTRTVHDTWEEEGYFDMPISNGTMWFDGYDLDKNVLLDDFNGRMSKVRLDTLLRILDRYVIQVPVKTSYCWWMPSSIAITSNFHPRDWYDYTKREESYNALCRRIHQVLVFDEDGSHEVEDLKEYWKKDPTNDFVCYCCNQNKSYKEFMNKQ